MENASRLPRFGPVIREVPLGEKFDVCFSFNQINDTSNDSKITIHNLEEIELQLTKIPDVC